MQDIHIRRAAISDVPSMCEMLSKLFSIETDFKSDRETQEAGLKLLLSDRRSIALIANTNSVIGMVTGQIVISTAAGGYSILIEDLFVMPEFRRQGLASRLITHLEYHARSASAVRAQLVTDSTNAPAIAFYRKLGFDTGRMAGMYKTITRP
jgi:ribosomal protein S18 acetylase RimI-like enzyme